MTNVATDFSSPGDSRLQSFSSFFCESVSIELHSTDTSASVTLVSTCPLLTDKNSFNITDQRILGPRNFRFWQYHLYPNSNISVNTCVLRQNRNTPEVIVYIIKGNSNANNWGRSPDSAHAEVFRSVRAECLNATNITMSYNVLEEDEYYVFYPQRFSISSYSTTLQFERFEYALPSHNETLLPSCTARPRQQSQCSTVLLTFPMAQALNWL